MSLYHEMNRKLCELNFAKKSRLDLQSILSLYNKLFLKNIPKIHVAGTNGKGSCVFKISQAFALNGYKCGLFTSPHIATFRERIQINGQMISKDDAATYAEEIFNLAKIHDKNLTFFEVITLMAFKYFSDQNVDVMVIEVGLGGRLDATNCIHPILSIITSISFDHTHILGDTLEKIAYEKSGIIKKNTPLVLGPCARQNSIYKKAKVMDSLIIEVDGDFENYDQENQAIAKSALNFLSKSFLFKKATIEEAILKNLPARREKIQFLGREILLDLSHNEDGLSRLFQEISKSYVKDKVTVFTSMAFNHDYAKNLSILREYAKKIVILDVKHPRLASSNDLKNACVNSQVCSLDQITSIISKLPKDSIAVFTGSIFIMDKVYKLLEVEIERDEFEIHDGVFPKGSACTLI